MYLLLGAPSSGKTTLLKAIAGLLPNPRILAGKNKGQPRPNSPFIDGIVEYNGQTMENNKFFLRNAISFIDQLERHAPRLTVRETFEFAFQCMSGGTHRPPGYYQDTVSNGTTHNDSFHNMNVKHTLVQYTMEMLGLSHVADTFVGDSNVRGISGGQRRRVTVGEMLQSIPSVSVMCADEVSNGLDSRSTFAIINYLADLCRINQRTRVISLLQPSPETFSLFDEVIILAEGHIIYAGPINRVVQYFEGLGYPLPKRMDVADYLQTVSTPDGAELFKPSSGSPQKTHFTAKAFAEAFQSSHLGKEIIHALKSPHPHPWRPIIKFPCS
jgi:ABC-type multidrug transport system ATPase subunit